MEHNREYFGSSGIWDNTGAAVSWACAVHCAAMPLLVSSLPFLGAGFLAHEGAEFIFIGVSLIVAAFTILPGFFRFHRKIRTLLLFGGGISLMIAADGIFEDNFAGKTIALFLGAAGVSAAHLLNRRLCRECRACGETGCRLSA